MVVQHSPVRDGEEKVARTLQCALHVVGKSAYPVMIAFKAPINPIYLLARRYQPGHYKFLSNNINLGYGLNSLMHK